MDAKIERQLSVSVQYLAAALRAGHSLGQAFECLAEDAPIPVAGMFKLMTAELGQGVSWDDALDGLQKRVNSAAVRAFVRVLKRQRMTGGNLAEPLGFLALAIRERAGSDGATEAQRERLRAWAGTAAIDPESLAAAEPQPWAAREAFGPLLDDPQVSEIMIDGPYAIRVERRGQLEDVPMHFLDSEHLLGVLRDLLAPYGIVLDERHPLTDAVLADGTRLSVALPPLCPIGPAVVMRKAVRQDLDIERLISFGSWNAAIVALLRACIVGRCNILVCGGTGSGKTTLTNVLIGMIPPEERVISVEETPDLIVNLPRHVPLLARKPGPDGMGGVSKAELVAHALKMRPERLVVGELMGREIWPTLTALNTGHDGSIALMHANNPRDALSRLEIMAAMAEPSAPLLSVRQQLAAAFQVIVTLNRLADGSRRVTHITEVIGMERDQIALRDLVVFEEQDGEHPGQGRFRGLTPPTFLNRLRQQGIAVPDGLWGRV